MEQVVNRASQPKSQSLFESVMNVAIGLGINICAQALVFPIFGIHIPFSSNLGIAGIFTIISITRGYVLRRWFNLKHVRTVEAYDTRVCDGSD